MTCSLSDEGSLREGTSGTSVSALGLCGLIRLVFGVVGRVESCVIGLVASEVRGGMVADLGLPQVPSLPGRQFIQGLLAFTQAQPRHEPVLLHLQQGILQSMSANPL